MRTAIAHGKGWISAIRSLLHGGLGGEHHHHSKSFLPSGPVSANRMNEQERRGPMTPERRRNLNMGPRLYNEEYR